MKTTEKVVTVVAAALLLAPWDLCGAQQPPPSPAAGGAREEDAGLYAQGTKAINESRWQDAVGLFDRAAGMHGGHAEGALYWKAYAQGKAGQAAEALRTCGELRRQHPHSRWLEECGALEIEIRGGSGDPVPPQTQGDEDLKLLALNALMQQDEAQAVPILERMLDGNQSQQLKGRALFVLAQSRSPQAQALIGQIAQGRSGPALQVQAIRMMAATGGGRADAMLADIYQHSSSTDVRRVILQSYLITGNAAKLSEVARRETNPELVKTALRSLGAMGAAQDLLTLYRSTDNSQMKAQIIDALIAGGHSGVAPLTGIVQSEEDAQLRHKAIRNLGIAGGAAVAPALLETYRRNPDVAARRAVAEALFLANDAHDLVALAREETDAHMRQYLVQQLSLMHSDEATAYMLEILSK